MGAYTEYLDMSMQYDAIHAERKRLLKNIKRLRGGRDIIVMASDLTKNVNNSIEYADILPFQDQLSSLNGTAIDIILETPGGFAEVVEDLVRLVRDKYERVAVIIPGYSKSAGTIFAMAADEILMGRFSALGPIDAQIASNGKRFSADAFLDGLDKIKEEVIANGGRLNPAMIPILQNISPGEIQHCENAQNFSIMLVKQWLASYKFKYWETHSSTGAKVTQEDKEKRAEEIASKLCKHSDWLTHGRSIKIDDFKKMKLLITDYSKVGELDDAITRYYTLLRMTFESTNIYKIFENKQTQILRFSVNGSPQMAMPPSAPQPKNDVALIDFECPNCRQHSLIQANLGVSKPLQPGSLKFPIIDNMFACPKCNSANNILAIRIQVEAQSGKKIVD